MSDNSGISYFAVMRKARELNLPVMLSGFGGDELFWGYAWVRRAVEATRRKQKLRNGGEIGLRDYLSITKPPYSYTGAVRWAQSLGGLRSGWQQYRRDKTSPIDQMVFYDSEVGFIDATARVGRHYTADFAQAIDPGKPCDLFTIPQPWPRADIAITCLICDTYMAENGIAQGDRLSMAASIELRLPLLDYRLVETAIGLRKANEDHHLPPKHWFREAIKDVVPAFVLNKRKRGFSTPWRVWNKAVADTYADQLKGGYLVNRGILTPRSAEWMSRQIRPRPFCMPVELAMTALMLEMWCRQMGGGGNSVRG
jgi:asparagine synthase (glutamine-hydrolysing)